MPRQRKVSPEQLQSLEQRLAKAQRDLRYAKAQEKKQARAVDARRKIIAGALALEHFEKNPESEFGRIMFRLLDDYTRPHERPLFGFLPSREAPALPPVSDAEPAAPTEAAA